MTTPDPGGEARNAEIQGRTIAVHPLLDSQLALMAREARTLQRDDVEGGRKMVGAARLFDIIESVIVQETDREFLLDEIVGRRLEFKDILDGIVKAHANQGEEKPRVRRGRPPTKRQ